MVLVKALPKILALFNGADISEFERELSLPNRDQGLLLQREVLGGSDWSMRGAM